MQESLRLNPIAAGLFRQASRDDVIPLSSPIMTKSGQLISEIPISKGQNIAISVGGYNRYGHPYESSAFAHLFPLLPGFRVCGVRMPMSGTRCDFWMPRRINRYPSVFTLICKFDGRCSRSMQSDYLPPCKDDFLWVSCVTGLFLSLNSGSRLAAGVRGCIG